MSAQESRDSCTETREQIMKATYRALCTKGYANLTMQAIADEFEKSKATLHYHYDTKDELMTAFLEYLIDRFVSKIEAVETNDPKADMATMVGALLRGPVDNPDFQTAMLELRAQIPYNEVFREQFDQNDRAIRERIADIVRDGQEVGLYVDRDPNRIATDIMVMVDGARTRSVVHDDDEVVDATHAMIERYLGVELQEEV